LKHLLIVTIGYGFFIIYPIIATNIFTKNDHKIQTLK